MHKICFCAGFGNLSLSLTSTRRGLYSMIHLTLQSDGAGDLQVPTQNDWSRVSATPERCGAEGLWDSKEHPRARPRHLHYGVQRESYSTQYVSVDLRECLQTFCELHKHPLICPPKKPNYLSKIFWISSSHANVKCFRQAILTFRPRPLCLSNTEGTQMKA